MKHLLEIDDLAPHEIQKVLDLSKTSVTSSSGYPGIALVFEMPSARTRNSAEMAAFQIGAHPVYIDESELGFDTRESVEDIGRTLACYYSIVCARLHDHQTLERLASLNAAPIVNLLSSESHPLQALADLLTIQDEFGSLEGVQIAYVGEPNNVWKSLALGAAALGMTVKTAVPETHYPTEDDLARVKRAGAEVAVTNDPMEAVEGAHVVYTDKWVSMSDNVDAISRKLEFAGFTVTEQLMTAAAAEAIFMHCLPASRGDEVTSAVIDGESSRVWAQAANRMHATRGLFAWLLSQG